MLNPVELVLRYSDISSDFDGSITDFVSEDGEVFSEDLGSMGSRIYGGVNYWLTPSAVLKLGAESTSIDDEDLFNAAGGVVQDDRVFLQLAFGF